MFQQELQRPTLSVQVAHNFFLKVKLKSVCHLDIEDMCAESINHAQLNFVSTVQL